MQLDIIFRKGSPDVLFTHSSDQKIYISKKLGWPKKRVKLVESMRYLRSENIKYYKNKIFLPYFIDEKTEYLKKFAFFLKSCRDRSLPKLVIKPHPAPYNTSDQQKFIKKLQQHMKFYNKKFRSSNLNTSSIIFGLSTSFLLLEKGEYFI